MQGSVGAKVDEHDYIDRIAVRAPWTADMWMPPHRAATVEDRESTWPAPLRRIVGRPRAAARLLTNRLFAAWRRLWGQTLITVDVSDEFARVVVIEGSKIVAWGKSLVGGPDEDRDSRSPETAGSTAEALHLLIRQTYGRPGRLVSCIPLYASILRHLRLPTSSHDYLEPMVLAEVNDSTPFQEGELDVSWQYRGLGSGRDVFAIAVPKREMDEHVSLIGEARRKPSAAYSRAAALVSAVGRADIVVVDAHASSLSVVLSWDGFPRVVHRLEIDVAELGHRQWVERVGQVLEQVVKYAQSVMGFEEIEPTPVAFTGPLAGDRSLLKALSLGVDREVISPAPPLSWPDHFPVHEYAANLGAAIQYQRRPRLRRRVAGPGAPSINLLPDRHLPRPLPLLPIAVLASLLLAGYVGFSVNTQLKDLALERDTLEQRATQLERQARIHRLGAARAKVLVDAREETAELAGLLEERIAFQRAHILGASARLREATSATDASQVSLSSVITKGSGLVLAGSASSPAQVMRYALDLQATGTFSRVEVLKLLDSGSGGPGSATFQIDASAAPLPDPQIEGHKAAEALR